MGIKSPSKDFSDKVMGDISALPGEVPIYKKWKARVLVIACCVLLVLSIFVRLPEIKFLDHTIEFSPVIVPIITMIFLFLVIQQIYELSCKVIEPNEQSIA